MKMVPVPLPLPKDLRERGRSLARIAGISRNQVLREAIRAGLPAVEARLSVPERLFPNIPPLPKGALARWYRSRASKEWDRMDKAVRKSRPTPAYDQ